MNLPWNKPQPPYQQSELQEYLASLDHLNKLRDSAMQKVVVYSNSDVKQQHYLEEVDKYDDMIHISQLVYEFMIEEVDAYNKRMQLKRKGN